MSKCRVGARSIENTGPVVDIALIRDGRVREQHQPLPDPVVRIVGPEHALAELNDFLHALPSSQVLEAVAEAELGGLSPFLQNYVTAMVEQACGQKHVDPPAWVRHVPVLAHPYFATSMKSLRMHLLRSSPVPFKRRNLFIDAGVGARV